MLCMERERYEQREGPKKRWTGSGGSVIGRVRRLADKHYTMPLQVDSTTARRGNGRWKWPQRIADGRIFRATLGGREVSVTSPLILISIRPLLSISFDKCHNSITPSSHNTHIKLPIIA